MSSTESGLQGWQKELAGDLQRLDQDNLLRRLRPHHGRLDFSSNDYLSLNSNGTLHGLLRQIVLEEKEDAFVGSTGSRLIRGHYRVFDQLEDEFCAWLRVPAALFFHSGYAANTGSLAALLDARDVAFVDRLCHASLLDGVRLSGATRYYFEHNDLNSLKEQLQKRPCRGRRWIITESVFSMDGDLPDLRALCDLAEAHDALLFLDEAHAIGVRGPQGAGLAAEAGVVDRIAVLSVPCGKAPGLMGAFVAGPPELKEWLINRARPFVFTTAQPPLFAELLRRTIKIIASAEMDRARQEIQQLSARLRHGAAQLGFECGRSQSQIVPLITGDEASALRLAEALQNEGLDVRAIRPPTVPAGSSRLRVSLQAAHRAADVDQLLATLAQVGTNQISSSRSS